jgi:hypothetical protein
VAVLALTGSAEVLGGLTDVVDYPLSVVGQTAVDNGDGTWTVTAETSEDNIAALQGAGCTVVVVTSDADQLSLWQTIDTQINDEPPTA